MDGVRKKVRWSISRFVRPVELVVGVGLVVVRTCRTGISSSCYVSLTEVGEQDAGVSVEMIKSEKAKKRREECGMGVYVCTRVGGRG